jgi:hypothetical protein
MYFPNGAIVAFIAYFGLVAAQFHESPSFYRRSELDALYERDLYMRELYNRRALYPRVNGNGMKTQQKALAAARLSGDQAAIKAAEDKVQAAAARKAANPKGQRPPLNGGAQAAAQPAQAAAQPAQPDQQPNPQSPPSKRSAYPTQYYTRDSIYAREAELDVIDYEGF